MENFSFRSCRGFHRHGIHDPGSGSSLGFQRRSSARHPAKGLGTLFSGTRFGPLPPLVLWPEHIGHRGGQRPPPKRIFFSGTPVPTSDPSTFSGNSGGDDPLSHPPVRSRDKDRTEPVSSPEKQDRRHGRASPKNFRKHFGPEAPGSRLPVRTGLPDPRGSAGTFRKRPGPFPTGKFLTRA